MPRLDDRELFELGEVLVEMVGEIHYLYTAIAAVAAKTGVVYDFHGPGKTEHLDELIQRLRTVLQPYEELKEEGNAPAPGDPGTPPRPLLVRLESRRRIDSDQCIDSPQKQ